MKDSLRKLYLEERKNISDEDKKVCGAEIARRVLETDEYKKSEEIFIYINMKNEAPTVGIINKALKEGKKVAVPVTLKNREMFFVYINGLDNLAKNSMGVYEPRAERKDEAVPGKSSLLVVPGVAFDVSGRRMGYGGGYYDTYIEKYGIKNTLAIAFDMQVKEEIPSQKHHKMMEILITEKRKIGGSENEQTD